MDDQQEIPEGYVPILYDNGQHYIVPRFMIPATHQAMEAYQKKVDFNVHTALGGVRFPSVQYQGWWPVLCLWLMLCLWPML